MKQVAKDIVSSNLLRQKKKSKSLIELAKPGTVSPLASKSSPELSGSRPTFRGSLLAELSRRVSRMKQVAKDIVSSNLLRQKKKSKSLIELAKPGTVSPLASKSSPELSVQMLASGFNRKSLLMPELISHPWWIARGFFATTKLSS
ncbi:unnamed protein product [Ilex paraguariensis]|uniref:Uncharacterized protein n=1 Tax=Ilex paraguariensis TaxID=185542 RepID=A0ABC8TGC9_9AQUA